MTYSGSVRTRFSCYTHGPVGGGWGAFVNTVMNSQLVKQDEEFLD